MRRIVDRILQSDYFREQPPVFVDVGASAGLPPQWSTFASYAVCIAFDADSRDFSVSEAKGSAWKKLYAFNRLVTPEPSAQVEFFLTKSPYCSSSLKPLTRALEPWAFSELFTVERTTKLQGVDLATALAHIRITRIDWIKCDSQGTDLRLFKSIPESIANRILAVDLEPGIIDVYEGEDKLHHVMASMEGRPFWVSDMVLKGSQRIDAEDRAQLNPLQRRFLSTFVKTSPCWCEISYLNSLDAADFGIRDMLLAWIVSSIKQQHGFSMHIAQLGERRFHMPIFDELFTASQRRLRRGYLNLAAKVARRLVWPKK